MSVENNEGEMYIGSFVLRSKINTELILTRVRVCENFRLYQVFIINNHFLDSFFIHALLTYVLC